ncbi:MAG TPA: hypothetical protein VNU19_24235, partial [Candidatus Acidoferrum sp.]|nr:hypothetical protein [Candidatus Acidoferrum sp.]
NSQVPGRTLATLAGSLVLSALMASVAVASPAILTAGHAYCYYFSTAGRSGGMHLVAAAPTVIAAGPSNYVSGVRGKPQDSVFYVDCVAGHGRIGGDEYVGIPRIDLHWAGSEYVFDRQFVVGGLKHIGVNSPDRTTASVRLSGSVTAGVINGVVRISAPGCLPHAIAVRYTGR